jgi:hypothetical protein
MFTKEFFLIDRLNLLVFFNVVIDQARANINEVHFLPFNPVDKRTALTYVDGDGNWHRASKGAPEQVNMSFILLCFNLFFIGRT